MSYDILVFDPAATSDEDFPAWWEDAASWSETGHGYDDPSVTTAGLRAFYEDMCQQFPDMHGPQAPSDEDLDNDPSRAEDLAEYTIGRQLVYMGFRWSAAARARAMTETLALRHGVAVARVSHDSSILRP